MRRTLVATLAAISTLALSQAATAQPSHAPAMLLAKISAAPAPPVVPAVTHAAGVNLVIHQDVASDVDTIRSIARGPMVQSITEASAPKLVKAVETDLTPEEVAAGTKVKVRLVVDQQGVPRDIEVLSATSHDVADRTVAAVSQFRFKPASVNFNPIATTVTLAINIH